MHEGSYLPQVVAHRVLAQRISLGSISEAHITHPFESFSFTCG